MGYLVQSVAEINALRPNGLTVASFFGGIGGSSLGYRMAGFRVLYANEFSPSASRCYALNARKDTVVDARDVHEVRPSDVPAAPGELDLLDGSPPCFGAGTLILTRRGLIPINQVRINDLVVTHLGRWRRVCNVNSRIAATIAARGHGHPGIATTAEHPFYVRKARYVYKPLRRSKAKRSGYVRTFEKPAWTEIGGCGIVSKGKINDRVSSFWGMRRTYPADAIPEICRSDARLQRVELGPDLMWLAGLWLGDGWLRTGRAHMQPTNRGEVLICAAKDEADEVRKRIAIAGFNFSEAEMRTTIRFTICHTGLAEWLWEDFGRGAAGKTVPYWAFGMPPEWRQALFDGYIFADGHVPREGQQRSTSISWALTLGMAMLARSLDKAAGIRCVSNGRLKNHRIENRSVNVADASYIMDCFDRPKSFFIEGDFCWGMVKEIAATGRLEPVYNLQVEEDESYVADGLIVHNCTRFSMSGTQQDARGLGKKKRYAHGAEQKDEDLFEEFVRLRDGLRPRAFVAENVPGLARGVAKGFFLEILRELKRGYRVEARLVDAQWLGVPQRRERLIFVGVRNDLGLEPAFPEPQHSLVTVRQALAEPPPGASIEPETDIAKYAIGREWDRLNPGQQSDRYFNLFRAPLDAPVQTVTASAGDYLSAASVTHPTERRKFAIWELKRLSSFPDDFRMEGTYAERYRGLGNCVPPLMAKAVAEAIRDRVLLPARAVARTAARGRRSPARSKNAKSPKGAG